MASAMALNKVKRFTQRVHCSAVYLELVTKKDAKAWLEIQP